MLTQERRPRQTRGATHGRDGGPDNLGLLVLEVRDERERSGSRRVASSGESVCISDESDPVLGGKGAVLLGGLLAELVEVLGRVRDSVDSGRSGVELVEGRALEVDGSLSLVEERLGVRRRLAIVDGQELERHGPAGA